VTFDAVLIISFGGPQGRDDIRPFLANVLRGRRVAPERVEQVAHHYELARSGDWSRRIAESFPIRERPVQTLIQPLRSDCSKSRHSRARGRLRVFAHSVDTNEPTIFTALEKQFGLEFVAGGGPAPV
jgi:protoheme ferro-lyase